jgi:DNA (cytosine-5)-methyltransferase 1
VFANDIDENCRKTYEKNYGLKPEGDITKIKIEQIPNFDILCAGFPCQPFSKAGFQKGFNDDRGNLFFNICDIVKFHKPKYIILENVRNLASHDNGNTWKVIKQHIKNLGYYTYDTPLLLNVLHFNIPQNRERVVIICKRIDLGELPKLPLIDKKPKKSLTCFIKDVIDENVKNIKLTGKLKNVYLIWENFINLLYKNNIIIPKFPIWTDWWDNLFEENDEFYIKYKLWIDKNRKFYETNLNILSNWLTESRKNINWVGALRKFEWQAGNLTEENNSLNKCLWTYRGSGIRVKKCDYIPTLVAMSMIPIYGPKNRKLTPLELLRLQSFNDSFQFDEKYIYKQLGNAVNVKMIEKCVRFLLYSETLI